MRDLVMLFEDFVNENAETEDFFELERAGLLDRAQLVELLIINGIINPSNTAIVSNDLLRDSDGISFAVIFNGEVHKVRPDSVMADSLKNGDQLAFGLGEAVGAKYVVTKKYPNVGFVIVLDSDPYSGVDVDAKTNRRLYNLIQTKFAEPLKKLPSSQKMSTFMAESAYEDYTDLVKSGIFEPIDLVRSMMEFGEMTDQNTGYVYVVYGRESQPYRFELTLGGKKVKTVYYLEMTPDEQKKSVEEMCLDIARNEGFEYAVMLKNVGMPNFTVIINKDFHLEMSAKDFIEIHNASLKKEPVKNA